ncbi:MAG: type II toxin-antitoxin system VapC family toxin [Sphingomicrobium sp.]
MHLLDTDVLWALRKPPGEQADEGLSAWIADTAPANLFLSVATVLELEGGTGRIQRREKLLGGALRGWLDTQVRPAFEGRILPIDAAIARRWGQLSYPDPRDGLLAATALEHGFTVVTRDTAAFKLGRVRTLNPWTYRPSAPDAGWDEGSLTGSIWLKSLFR